MNEILRQLEHGLTSLKGKAVLVLGCGDGSLIAELAKYARSVVGVDEDPVKLAEARARNPGVRFVRRDPGDSENRLPFYFFRFHEIVAGPTLLERGSNIVAMAKQKAGEFRYKLGMESNPFDSPTFERIEP